MGLWDTMSYKSDAYPMKPRTINYGKIHVITFIALKSFHLLQDKSVIFCPLSRLLHYNPEHVSRKVIHIVFPCYDGVDAIFRINGNNK